MRLNGERRVILESEGEAPAGGGGRFDGDGLRDAVAGHPQHFAGRGVADEGQVGAHGRRHLRRHEHVLQLAAVSVESGRRDAVARAPAAQLERAPCERGAAHFAGGGELPDGFGARRVASGGGDGEVVAATASAACPLGRDKRGPSRRRGQRAHATTGGAALVAAHEVAAEDCGAFAEVFGDVRVEVLAQEGEDYVAYLVAEDGGVGVRGILAPGEAATAEVGAQVGIAEAEKGTDERDAVHVRDGLESGEALRTRAARHAHDERLGHVVGVVSGGDGVEAQLARHACEEREARTARSHFERFARTPPDARAKRAAGDSEARGERLHETRVVVRVGAQTVVDVQYDGLKPNCLAEVGESDEKGSGVGSAGNGEADCPGALLLDRVLHCYNYTISVGDYPLR